MTGDREPVLAARDVTRSFTTGGLLAGGRRTVQAVRGVDLAVRPGEVLGIVGESGSGKSTLASMLVGDLRPSTGEVDLGGRRLDRLRGRALRAARREVQLVRQDPYTSLDPRMDVESIVREPLEVHPDLVPRARRREEVRDLLGRVGLSPSLATRHPHQLSGGQRQRVGIARALALRPRVLVCDEPVSALDVSVQAQVINLLADLRDDLGVAVVLIAHDLSVVHHLADRVAVMYLGRVVEEGTPEEIDGRPRHPYTRALLDAVPQPDRVAGADRRRRQVVLVGEIPSPLSPPSGCSFRTRCWQAEERCASERPALSETGHGVACHFPLPAP